MAVGLAALAAEVEAQKQNGLYIDAFFSHDADGDVILQEIIFGAGTKGSSSIYFDDGYTYYIEMDIPFETTGVGAASFQYGVVQGIYDTEFQESQFYVASADKTMLKCVERYYPKEMSTGKIQLMSASRLTPFTTSSLYNQGRIRVYRYA